MKVNLKNQSFENIRIKNTSLIGANFVRCNFSGSKLGNEDISGVNLKIALLQNCKWKNIKINELNQLEGHKDSVRQVFFSFDGTKLASGSDDKSIRVWDIKSGQQTIQLDGHYGIVSIILLYLDIFEKNLQMKICQKQTVPKQGL